MPILVNGEIIPQELILDEERRLAGRMRTAADLREAFQRASRAWTVSPLHC